MIKKIITYLLAILLLLGIFMSVFSACGKKASMRDIDANKLNEYISYLEVDTGVYYEGDHIGSEFTSDDVFKIYTAHRILKSTGYEFTKSEASKNTELIENIFKNFRMNLEVYDELEYAVYAVLLADLLDYEIKYEDEQVFIKYISDLQIGNGGFAISFLDKNDYGIMGSDFIDLYSINIILDVSRILEMDYNKDKLLSLLKSMVDKWEISEDKVELLNITSSAAMYIEAVNTFGAAKDSETDAKLNEILKLAEENVPINDAYIYFWSDMIDIALHIGNDDADKYLENYADYMTENGFAIFPLSSDNTTFNDENAVNSAATRSALVAFEKCGETLPEEFKNSVSKDIQRCRLYDGRYRLDYTISYGEYNEQITNNIIRVLYEIDRLDGHREGVIDHLESRKTHPIYSDMKSYWELLAFSSAIICGYENDEELMETLRKTLDDIDSSLQKNPNSNTNAVSALIQFFEYQHLGNITYDEDVKERIIAMADHYGDTDKTDYNSFRQRVFRYQVYKCFGLETENMAESIIKTYNEVYNLERRDTSLKYYYASSICSLLSIEPKYKNQISGKDDILKEIAENKYNDILYKFPNNDWGEIDISTAMCIRIIKYFG